MTVNVWGTKFATGGTSLGLPVSGASDQFGEGGFGLNNGSSFGSINTLYSFIYIKSDRWGTLNWGHLSPASDNKVVLADISGTVIEFELGVLRGRELHPTSQGRQDWRLWRSR